MISTRHRWHQLMAGVACAALLMACGNGSDDTAEPAPGPADEPEPATTDAEAPADDEEATDVEDVLEMRFSATTPLSWPHAPVAEELGIWEDYGLSVSQTDFATGREALQSLLGGGAEFAQVAPGPIVFAAYAEQPVTILATTGRWDTWNVIARADADIETPADLAGKRVGITTGSSSELAFLNFLEDNGVDAADVEFVNVGPPDMISSITTGSVDAINTWEPLAFLAMEALGDDGVFFPYSFENNYLVVTTDDVAANQPELVERFMAATEAANEAIVTDTATAAEIIAELSQIEVDALLAIWDGYDFSVEQPGDSVVNEMTLLAEFAEERGDTEGDRPDFTDLFWTP